MDGADLMSAASVIPRSIEAPALPTMNPQLAAQSGEGIARAGAAVTDFANAWGNAQDESALVSARLSAAQQLDDLHQQYLRDPDQATAPQRFKDAADAVGENLIQTIKQPQNRNAFTADIGNMTEGRRLSLMDNSFQQQTSQALANLDTAQETYSRQAAYATNPIERQAAVTAYTQSVNGVVQKGMLNPDQASKMVQGFSEKLSLYDGRALVQQNPSLAMAKLKDPNFLPDLDPLGRVELQSGAEAEVWRRQSEARMANAEARANASSALSDFNSVVGSGLPPSQDVLDRTRAAIAASGDPRLQAQFARSIQAANFSYSMRGATQEQLSTTIDGLDAKAQASGADSALAAAEHGARVYLDKTNKGLAHDPLDWASKQGVVTIAPLKLDGSDDALAWQNRTRAADVASQHYGIPPAYLTADEKTTLGQKLDISQAADERLKTVHMLVSALGSRALPVLASLTTGRTNAGGANFRGINGADPLGALVTAGGLLNDGPAYVPTARDIANGDALARARPELRPKLASFAGDGDDMTLGNLRTAYAAFPQELGRVTDAASAIYAKRASDAGLTGADVTGSKGATIMGQALDAASGAHYVDGAKFGGLTLYNGAPVIAPSNIAAGSLEDLAHHLTANDLARASVTGQKPVIGGQDVGDDTLRNSWLVTSGSGRYWISTTDPTKGAVTPIRDAKGHIYNLDFNKALTLLQSRSAQ